MDEETQEVPKWLKELEEKREKRVKARLGHEAGAGSPCLTCEEKCPGLDLHFWRKICKNCKCGKENHDVNDDDIYGWAQFQLLGSKPNKGRKFVIPGRKDAVELEWMPKGQNDVVESYLKDLPVNLLPIKGSAAAQERKQLLQKQIPLHDIDPTLCHALSDHEIKQMNDYIAHVKQNSVGVGHIMKLNELLKNRQSANAQFLASRAPMQLSQGQNIVLQGVDRANLLYKGLRDLNIDEQKLHNVSQSEQVAANANIRDVAYDAYGRNGNAPDSRNPQNMRVPNQPVANQIDYQNAANIGAVRDINYPNNPGTYPSIQGGHPNIQGGQFIVQTGQPHIQGGQGKVQTGYPNIQGGQVNVQTGQAGYLNNQSANLHNQGGNMQIPNRALQSHVDHQSATNPSSIRDVHYPVVNQNVDPKLGNVQIPNQPMYNQIDYQNPNLATLKDLHYALNDLHSSPNQTTEGLNAQNMKNLPHFAKNSLTNVENVQKPIDYGNIRNVYPDMNVNFEHGDLNTNPELLDNVSRLKGDPNMPHYAPGKLNMFVEQQNPQKIGNIKDLAYSTYDPHSNLDLSNENLQCDFSRGVFDSKNPEQRFNPHSFEQMNSNIENRAKYTPANYNPNELNVMEQNLNPTAVNVGIINDIEYPTIKAAVQRQNDLFEPNVPRKNVQFDLSQDDEILPSCHKCKKMFDATALVIGIDHTDALWHAECFKCSGCNQNLADLMYFYHKESDDIYCGRDYAKIRGIPRCQACDELIFVKEYCLAENSTFHVKHFCCFECDETLAGQNYVMEDSQPLCLPCFEKVKAEKCNTCLKVIKPDEQGANLNGVHFHADDDCFACKMCKKPLLGAKLLFKNRNLYCSAPCFSADK